MATLSERVTAYTGNLPSLTNVADWLTAGARRIVDMIPPRELSRYATAHAVTPTGWDTAAGRLVSAYVGTRVCRNLESRFAADVNDPSSIHFASAQDPVYYVEGSTLQLRPGGNGTVHAVGYPVLTGSEDGIAKFPVALEDAVVLFASTRVTLQQLETERLLMVGDLTELRAELSAISLEITFDITAELSAFDAAMTEEDIELAITFLQKAATKLSAARVGSETLGLKIQTAMAKWKGRADIIAVLTRRYEWLLNLELAHFVYLFGKEAKRDS